jgi:hypothetical protein
MFASMARWMASRIDSLPSGSANEQLMTSTSCSTASWMAAASMSVWTFRIVSAMRTG